MIPPKPIRGRHPLAIDGEAASHRRARSRRRSIQAAGGIGEAFAVARQRLHVRQQVMREEHRLRRLRMRMRGEDRVQLVGGPRGERLHACLQRFVDAASRVEQPEPLVGDDLLVPAAPGLEVSRQLGP